VNFHFGSIAWRCGRFGDASFAGIRYRVSHDPAGREIGLALFGNEGVDESLIVAEDRPMASTVIEEVRSRFGIVVLPTPSQSD
jgi:hypothetical protein